MTQCVAGRGVSRPRFPLSTGLDQYIDGATDVVDALHNGSLPLHLRLKALLVILVRLAGRDVVEPAQGVLADLVIGRETGERELRGARFEVSRKVLS